MTLQYVLSSLYTPALAAVLLAANPVLTYVLLRRAGVRGAKLGLALLSPVMLILGALVFPLMLEAMVHQVFEEGNVNGVTPAARILFGLIEPGSILAVQIARSVCISIGCIAPFAILAIVKWPSLNNSRDTVEI